ncbi:MAG: hypothetical protein AAF429_02575 [Pseudomonadota bacterium]
MPFADAKFNEITSAMQTALGSGTLSPSDQDYINYMFKQLKQKGVRIQLPERELSRINDTLEPFIAGPVKTPVITKDPFKRYNRTIKTPTEQPVKPARKPGLIWVLMAVIALLLVVFFL